MNKLIVLILCLIIVFSAGCPEKTSNGHAVKVIPDKKISKQETLNFKINLERDSFSVDESTGFAVINKDGFDKFAGIEEGRPVLPHKVLFYYIPLGKKVSELKINDYFRREISLKVPLAVNSVPVPCCDPEGVLFPEKFDDSVFAKGLFPAASLEIVSKRMFGGIQIIQLDYSPFQYNGNNKLLVTESIDFSFVLEDFESNFIDVEKMKFLPKLENKSALLTDLKLESSNKSGEIYYFDESSPVEYLIITNDELAPFFVPLAEWKKQKGLNAKIVSLQDAYAFVDSIPELNPRDDAEKLRFYIKEIYNQGALNWVLLGGDEDVLPLRYCYPASTDIVPDLYNQQICDIYFAELDYDWDLDNDNVWGEYKWAYDDFVPGQNPLDVDVFIGRIPFHTFEQVQDIVHKMIEYEKNPGNGDASYVLDFSVFASDHMRDYSNYEGEDSIIAAILPDNFNVDLSLREELSGDSEEPVSPTAGQAIESLSQGFGNIYYLAHGSANLFELRTKGSNEDFPKHRIVTDAGNGYNFRSIEEIENYNKISFVNSASCYNAMFDAEKLDPEFTLPVVVEKWLDSSDKGAFAFIGNTRWGWTVSSHVLMKYFAENSLATGQFEGEEPAPIGVALANSKSYYYSAEDLVYGNNLFGDPETTLYTVVPKQLIQDIVVNGNSFDVTVSSEGIPLEGVTVTFTDNQGNFISSSTDIIGKAVVNLADLTKTGGEILVTSFKHNYIPVQETVSSVICGDVDNSSGIPNISDLIYLVNYMFQDGPEPVSFWAANVDGEYGIDIADLVYFVNWMVQDGPELNCSEPTTKTPDTKGTTYEEFNETYLKSNNIEIQTSES